MLLHGFNHIAAALIYTFTHPISKCYLVRLKGPKITYLKPLGPNQSHETAQNTHIYAAFSLEWFGMVKTMFWRPQVTPIPTLIHKSISPI